MKYITEKALKYPTTFAITTFLNMYNNTPAEESMTPVHSPGDLKHTCRKMHNNWMEA